MKEILDLILKFFEIARAAIFLLRDIKETRHHNKPKR